jgi:hypothetical protein
MRNRDLNRFVLSICVAVVMLAGCGGSQPLIGAPGSMSLPNASTSYKSLYSFGAGSDGQQPKAALINVNGTLYGTTYGGGVYADGTVFSASTTGTENELYSFQGDRDGANPSASLLAVKGVLYGTTVGEAFAATTRARTRAYLNIHLIYTSVECSQRVAV